MVTKEAIRAFAQFLVILFSIEDLIGNSNVIRLETKWLGLSSKIFSRWKSWFRNSFVWWGYLLLYSILVLLPLIIFAGIAWGGYQLDSRMIVESSTWSGSLFITIIGFGAIISWGILVLITDFFVDISSGEDPPLEIRILRAFSKISVSDSPWHKIFSDLFGATGSSIGLLIPVLFSGTFVPTSSIVVIVLRLSLLLLIIIIWLIFFAPANVLRGLANKTGANSFIKVGKYLLAIFMYIMTYII